MGSAIREFVAARQKLPPGHSLIEAADYFRKRNPVAPTNKNIGDIVAEMLEAKRKAGVSEIHLRILKGRLERFAQNFQCPIPPSPCKMFQNMSATSKRRMARL